MKPTSPVAVDSAFDLPSLVLPRGLERAAEAVRAAGLGRTVRVEPRGRRGQAAIVRLDDGSEVFVKLAPLDGVDAGMRTEREVAAARTLPGLTPAVLAAAEDGSWVVLEGVEGEPLSSTPTDLDLDTGLAADLGAMLAAVHRAGHRGNPDRLRREAPVTDLPSAEVQLPPIDDVTPTRFALAPGFDYPVWLAFVQDEPLAGAIRDLAATWTVATLIHGDLRGDNVIATPTRRLVPVDWELGGLGDPRADLGALVALYLSAWLSSIRATEDGELADWLATATVPLDAIRPPIDAAVRSYRDGVTSVADTRADLELALRWAGACLLRQALAILDHRGGHAPSSRPLASSSRSPSRTSPTRASSCAMIWRSSAWLPR